MTNKLRTVLYVGVTSNLLARVLEHRKHLYNNSFTAKYKCEILVYHEYWEDITAAIAREKEIKKWRREKKNNLISSQNPYWKNLWNEVKDD